MPRQNTIQIFKKYQKSTDKKHQEYLRVFEKKMLYRTTKTENPQTTRKMVQQVLDKIRMKV